MRWQQGRSTIDGLLSRGEGLRGTSRGGHIAVAEAVCAQLDPPLGAIVRPFDRMRRRPNDAEYPRPDVPGFIAADVLADVEKVERIRDAAERVLDEMSAY